MKSIQEEANAMLQSMIENGGKLEGEKGAAMSHALTRILPADGFVLMIVTNQGDRVRGVGLCAGELDPGVTMKALLNVLADVTKKIGIETVIETGACNCPKCQAERQKETVH
ncbi:hypothetical protein [Desulfovibrio cuneatus]|uniref:hypothetical protein n=1 Tax=Desulfovibrio cuneatus TaxID=159728 RepID=UPI000429830B|nr:hypothetical protein [Desulfovibrio cuneatus]